MMNDDQIEALLRRYRVGDPPSGVKVKALSGKRLPARVELTAPDWAMVAVVAILVALGVATEPAPYETVSAAEAAWAAEVDAMAALIGGGTAATRIVEMTIPHPSVYGIEPVEEP
jgi:hypothetical protein